MCIKCVDHKNFKIVEQKNFKIVEQKTHHEKREREGEYPLH